MSYLKETNHVENEIIFIEKNLIHLSLIDRVLFLISRLNKNFYDDLNNSRISSDPNGSDVYDTTLDSDIEKSDFLNKYGNETVKTHILNYLGWSENAADPKSNYFILLSNQFNTSYTHRLEHFQHRLLNDSPFLLLAPFIYSKERLLDIIVYELSLINHDEIEFYKNKVISSFHEVALRINSYIVWDVNNEVHRTFENPSLAPEDYYLKIEWAEFIGVDKRETYSLMECIEDLNKLNTDQIKNLSSVLKRRVKKRIKIEYSKSPLKLRDLVCRFFEIKNFELEDDKRKRVNRFLNNCFDFDVKYPKVNENSYESIDFFTKETFKPFVALLVYLSKKDILDFKNPLTLSNLLLNEFKSINKSYIGLSNKLRDVISQELIISNNTELINIIGFDKPHEIDVFLKN